MSNIDSNITTQANLNVQSLFFSAATVGIVKM